MSKINKRDMILGYVALLSAISYFVFLLRRTDVPFIFLTVIFSSLVTVLYFYALNLRKINKNPSYYSYLEEATKGMVFVRDIRKLQGLIVRILTRALKISHVRLFLFNEKEGVFECVSTRGKERRRQTSNAFNMKHPLIRLVNKERKPIIVQELKSKYLKIYPNLAVKQIEQDFRALGTVLFIPEFIKGQLSGFISLGGKINKKPYTNDDIEVLTELSKQASFAIENAQFYSKVKEHEVDQVQTYKLMALGEMATSFAHQINNPLQGIVGAQTLVKFIMNNWLKSQETNEYVHKEKIETIFKEVDLQLAKVKGEVFHIAEIVKTIMSNTKQLDCERVDVIDLLQKGLDLIPKSKFQEKKISIKTNIDDDIKDLFIKPMDIKQVIMNLGINAIEAMDREGELLIDVKLSKKKENYMELRFIDTGHGIPQSIKNKVFDVFFTTKGSSGSGLGLPLVHKMVADSMGYVELESEEGIGTTFTVFLPAYVE